MFSSRPAIAAEAIETTESTESSVSLAAETAEGEEGSTEATESSEVDEEENTTLTGDVNQDGKVTTADVGLANSHAKGIKLLVGEQFEIADVNEDGKVSTADVGIINRIAKGLGYNGQETTETTETTEATESTDSTEATEETTEATEGTTYSTEEHTCNYEYTKTVGATMSNRGYDLYTCSICGKTYKTNYTDKIPIPTEAAVVGQASVESVQVSDTAITISYKNASNGTGARLYEACVCYDLDTLDENLGDANQWWVRNGLKEGIPPEATNRYCYDSDATYSFELTDCEPNSVYFFCISPFMYYYETGVIADGASVSWGEDIYFMAITSREGETTFVELDLNERYQEQYEKAVALVDLVEANIPTDEEFEENCIEDYDNEILIGYMLWNAFNREDAEELIAGWRHNISSLFNYIDSDINEYNLGGTASLKTLGKIVSATSDAYYTSLLEWGINEDGMWKLAPCDMNSAYPNELCTIDNPPFESWDELWYNYMHIFEFYLSNSMII